MDIALRAVFIMSGKRRLRLQTDFRWRTTAEIFTDKQIFGRKYAILRCANATYYTAMRYSFSPKSVQQIRRGKVPKTAIMFREYRLFASR